MRSAHHPEVIAVEAAAGFALDSRETIKITADANFSHRDIDFRYIYRVPVVVGTPESYRATDIVVIVDDSMPNPVYGIFLR